MVEEENAGVEQTEVDLDKYMIRWNRFRRESGHVLGASELLALGDLLLELDAYLARQGTDMNWDSPSFGFRVRLERLLGMHPGSLDTSRRV